MKSAGLPTIGSLVRGPSSLQSPNRFSAQGNFVFQPSNDQPLFCASAPQRRAHLARLTFSFPLDNKSKDVGELPRLPRTARCSDPLNILNDRVDSVFLSQMANMLHAVLVKGEVEQVRAAIVDVQHVGELSPEASVMLEEARQRLLELETIDSLKAAASGCDVERLQQVIDEARAAGFHWEEIDEAERLVAVLSPEPQFGSGQPVDDAGSLTPLLALRGGDEVSQDGSAKALQAVKTLQAAAERGNPHELQVAIDNTKGFICGHKRDDVEEQQISARSWTILVEALQNGDARAVRYVLNRARTDAPHRHRRRGPRALGG